MFLCWRWFGVGVFIDLICFRGTWRQCIDSFKKKYMMCITVYTVFALFANIFKQQKLFFGNLLLSFFISPIFLDFYLWFCWQMESFFLISWNFISHSNVNCVWSVRMSFKEPSRLPMIKLWLRQVFSFSIHSFLL